MHTQTLARLLREHGVSAPSANAIVAEMSATQSRKVRVTHARDWDLLVAPLQAQIKNLGSSQHRWGKDPLRAPVFGPYLTLLRQTRDRIRAAQALNAVGDDLTIPEYAAARKPTPIPLDGMVWSAWIPQRMKDPFILAFDQLYSTDEGRKAGKRITPFFTAKQATASDMRWNRLTAQLHAEIIARKGIAAQAPLVEAMQEALIVINERDLLDVAPVQWEHLLPKQRQQQIKGWLEGSAVADILSAPTNPEE